MFASLSFVLRLGLRLARRDDWPCLLVVSAVIGTCLLGCPKGGAGQSRPSQYGTTPPGVAPPGTQPGEGPGSAAIELPDSPQQEQAPSEPSVHGTDAVGVILPLSGRGRVVGERALRGLQIAVSEVRTSSVPKFIVRDSQGDAAVAEKAARELLDERGVSAIIGPLGAATSERVARVAEQMSVPMVSLSPAPTITGLGSHVFRACVTADGEIDALVRHARNQRAAKFALLYPENAFGRTMRDVASRTIAAQGAKVSVQASYPPGATSVREAMTSLESFRPDAVLVLDSARAVSVLVPALASIGLRPSADEGAAGRIVLVPSVGFDPQKLRPALRHLSGVVFSAPFHPDIAGEFGKQFAERYREAYNELPDLFAASSFDVSRFMILAKIERGPLTARSVQAVLEGIRGIETAGPGQGFGPGGEPSRPTRLATWNGERWTRVYSTKE